MTDNKNNTDHIKYHKITDAFLSTVGELKIYLKRFFNSQQDIEDVLQETYLRAIESEKKEDIKLPRPFLYKVSRNLALNLKSSAAMKVTDAVEDFDALSVLITERPLEDDVEQQLRFAQFCKAVSRLPEQCRKVMVLKKIYGLGNKEIADKLNITVSTVDKHLAKGLLMTKQFMDSRGYGMNNKTAQLKRNAK